MNALLAADLVERGLASWWAPALAFAAGIVSFASPCVFPLVPGYLSFVSGEVGVEVRERAPLRRTLLPVGLFGPEAGWFVPNQLIFARSHHEWDALPDGIPRHATYRDPETPR